MFMIYSKYENNNEYSITIINFALMHLQNSVLSDPFTIVHYTINRHGRITSNIKLSVAV